jgi:hypothetical protein
MSVNSESSVVTTAGNYWSIAVPTGRFHNSTSEADMYANVAREWLATAHLKRTAPTARQQGAATTSQTEGTMSALYYDSLAPIGPQRIVGLQKWAGQITAIDPQSLTTELYPLDHDGDPIIADFDRKLLGTDSSLAVVGSVVYLTTRLVQDRDGDVEAMTRLRLRRPWRWSAAELSAAFKRARTRAKSIAKYAKRSPAQ